MRRMVVGLSMGGVVLVLLGAALGRVSKGKPADDGVVRAPTASAAPSREAHRPASDPELRRELDRLRDQVEQIDQELSDQAEEAEANEAEANQPPPTPEEIAAEEGATSASFAVRFERESDDRTWSRGREQELLTDGTGRRGVQNMKVACRERLCQVDVALDGVSALDFLQEIAFEPAWNAETWWHVTDGGLEMYLARQGYGLATGMPVPQG